MYIQEQLSSVLNLLANKITVRVKRMGMVYNVSLSFSEISLLYDISIC